jgi:hypothetical protein
MLSMAMNLVLFTLVLFAPELSDLDRALERLSSPQAAERRSAERWLAVHLEREDYPRLAEIATSESQEVRARLADALSADRNLGLSALLIGEDDPSLRELGEGAVRRSLARWYEAPELEWLSPKDRLGKFRPIKGLRLGKDTFPSAYRLDPTAERFDLALDRIARHADSQALEGSWSGPVTVVVDPVASAHPPGLPVRSGEIDGNFGTLVSETAGAWGLRLYVAGFEMRHPVAFVTSGPEPRSWFELMTGWVRELERSGPLAAEAARALACSGWPAAMGWIEERWLEAGDAAFLDGLLIAAGRGRVALGLARAGSVRVLRDMACNESIPVWRRDQAARALIAVGGTAGDGEDLVPALLEGWDEREESQRSFCARILSGWGRAPERLRNEWRDRLESDSARISAQARLTALFALAHTSPEPLRALRLSSDAALLEHAQSLGRLAPMLAWLQRLQVPLPGSWSEHSDTEIQLALMTHAILEESSDSAQRAARITARLLALGIAEERLGEVLRHAGVRAGDGRLRAVISGLGPRGEAPSRPLQRERLALLAGVPLPGTIQVLTDDLARRAAFGATDWRVAGALLALPGGDAAGQLLMERVRQEIADWEQGDPGMEADWVEGCRRALDDMRARRFDSRAEELLKDLRVITRRSAHPLRRALIRNSAWPLSADRRPRSLDDFGALEPRSSESR